MDVVLRHLTETVSAEDLQKSEMVYLLCKNHITPIQQFEYASCLVRSKYPADIKQGIVLLQELYKSHKEGQRDYLYYLAIGNARIKKYSKALSYVRAFLSIEPGNVQVIAPESTIKTRMNKGLMDMAMAGGVVLAVGALVELGMAAARKN